VSNNGIQQTAAGVTWVSECTVLILLGVRIQSLLIQGVRPTVSQSAATQFGGVERFLSMDHDHRYLVVLASLAILILMAGCGDHICSPTCSSGRYLGCTLDGRPVTTGLYSGEVIAVHFWAVWCRPCTLQLAGLDSLQIDYGDDLQVVAVSCDKDDKGVRRFLDEHRLSILVTLDPTGVVSKSFGITTVPTDVLIDQAGSVCLVSVGFHQGLPEMRAKIDSLLSSSGH
jgi:peroxiredoxin